MKINSKDKIAAFPLLQIRDLLKSYQTLNIDIIEDFVKTNKTGANKILRELTAMGFVEAVKEQKLYTHQITLNGSTFSLAKAMARS